MLAPIRANILLLGIDYAQNQTFLGRSDTIIVVSFLPPEPSVDLISIPRDLWIDIPGNGQNRINTAHFFSEVKQTGSGGYGAIEAIEQNFNIPIDYYLRVRFDSFREIIDSMGGIDIELSQPVAGYNPGNYHLTGRKALAFSRNRLGSDDFFRMENNQFLLKAALKQLLRPSSWSKLPGVIKTIFFSVDTNIPFWQFPRMAFSLLRTGNGGINSYTITREMVIPYTTDQGANVLLPDWEQINNLFIKVLGP